MSELDPIRPPESRRYARSLILAATLVLGMILSISWWGSGEIWRLVVAAAVSAALGEAIARAFLKRWK